MVRWLVLLLIALLPLRGWVGDAMAGQMLVQQIAAAQAGGAPASHAAPHHHAAAMDHDCMNHGVAPEAAPAAQSPQDCPTCASCQVCSAVALVFDATAPPLSHAPSATPSWAGHGYPSAERAPAFKPPIS